MSDEPTATGEPEPPEAADTDALPETPGEIAADALAEETGTNAPHRLHGISPFFELIAGARQFLVPVIAGFAAGGDKGRIFGVVPLLLITGARCLTWLRFSYRIEGGAIRVEEGLFVRKHRSIPLDRIQQVDMVSKLRHRVMGVVGLHVDTASGSSGAELKLDVVSRSEAERLRHIIAIGAGGALRTDDEVHEVDSAYAAEIASRSPYIPPSVESHGDVVISLGLWPLAVAGMTGAQTAVVLGLVVWLRELGELLPFDRLRGVVPEGAERHPIAVISGLLFLATIWLSLAAAASILTNYGYTLTTRGDDLRVTRGLLDKREVSASRFRIQAVRIEQTFIRRMLRAAHVRIQTAAQPGQSVSSISIPLVPVAHVEKVVAALVADVGSMPELVPAPGVALRRAIMRRIVPTASLALPIGFFVRPWGLTALAALPIAVFAGVIHHRALGHTWDGRVLWARRGGLFRETVIIPAAKCQSLRLQSTPFQRRAGLATLMVDVAGKGSTPGVYDAAASRLEPLLSQVPAAATADERAARLARVGQTRTLVAEETDDALAGGRSS